MSIFNSDSESSDQFYKKKMIGEIQLEDTTLQLVGYAKNKNPSEEFTLEDETGKVFVREIPDEAEAIQEGKLYKVMGQMALDGAGTRYFAAEIVQNVESLNYKLYKKSMQLKKTI
ncbi:MAG: hypothetical protein ACTSVU_08665 [Promethearchaeota archaeon]